ncbi:hypothetical protein ACH5RR_014955 [Cinchona calisaya]|uniref:Bulb-type lectin domain-containing protein n=1 Tax=Cinchona calisaya TaxID=153742 RepID=A0ABD2ZRS1_9GENT
MIAWSTSIRNISTQAVVAQLLDSGNLILKYGSDGDSNENYIWQSFDQLSDTLLPGMKLGWDFRIGLNRYLKSWKSAEDPSPGEFTYGIDPGIFPQFFLLKGSIKQFRGGLYDFQLLHGTFVEQNPFFNPTFISTRDESHYQFDIFDDLSMLALSYTGTLQRYVWDNKNLVWNVIRTHRVMLVTVTIVVVQMLFAHLTLFSLVPV